MRFEYRPIPTLPRLAWCAELSRGSDTARVTHGPAVETARSHFSDGAWDGEFAEGRPDVAAVCMGMGGVAGEGKWTFVTPDHPMEGLYAWHDEGRLLVSPSLVFLLCESGQRLDSNLPCYQSIMYKFISGIGSGVGRLPLARGRHFDVYRLRILEIGTDLSLKARLKPDPPAFRDFTQYREYLQEKLSLLNANATSAARTIKFEPLCTASSGYDSVASAALASKAGCREAVTIRTARPAASGAHSLDDSGVAAASSLGMSVEEFDRDAYLRVDGTPEAEFVSAGDLGQDVVLTAFESKLSNRLVVTGLHGDVVWSKKLPHRPKRDIIRLDPGGASLGEFRMRVGFVHVPVPIIGAKNFPDIFRISRSPEMKPWTLNTKHDRPVPRRIAEECGVPRDAFGQYKRAVTVLLNSEERLASMMNPISRASFDEFYRERRHERHPSTQRLYNVGYRLHSAFDWLLSKPNAALHRFNTGLTLPNPLTSRFAHDPGKPSFLLFWGVELLASRYKTD